MKILITDPIEQSCIEILQREGFTVDVKTGLPPEEIKKIMQEQLSAATSIKSAPHTYTDNLNLHHSSQHQRFSPPKHGGGH